MNPLAFFRRQSLRVRITLSFVTTAALLTLALSATTYFTVRTVLENNRVASSTRQTVFAMLFAREFLSTEPDRPQQLVSLLQSRESFDAMLTQGEQWFATRLSLTPAAVPERLRDLVLEERLGYLPARVDGVRTLVYGGPLPPAETELYLFYPLADVDRTLSLLARVLVIAGLAAVAAAALLAQRISSRILRPLVGVSTAAQRVAEGLLETRVEASSRDELGTLAASFNQMAAALQDMIQRERRFVAAVSHELRTPLAALQATGQVLARRRHELSPVAQEAADLVVEDITDLRGLVEDLLEVSELDSGRARVRWERVDLRSLAQAVVRRRHRAAPIQGPAIETFADKARLERILGNLVDNAFQHGGADVALSLFEENGSCFVAVADRGPGIPQEDLPQLFEPFFKADPSRSRDRGGIGLGLAIAQQNARLLGGEIAVRSTEDGTSFTLRLPLRVDRPGEEDE